MTAHDRPSALRPEILAARCFTALVGTRAELLMTGGHLLDASLAKRACDLAAALLAEWKRRDPDTALPNGLPVDDAELEQVR